MAASDVLSFRNIAAQNLSASECSSLGNMLGNSIKVGAVGSMSLIMLKGQSPVINFGKIDFSCPERAISTLIFVKYFVCLMTDCQPAGMCVQRMNLHLVAKHSFGFS